MNRLIQQKIVDHFREGKEVWFNRSETKRSRAVLVTDEMVGEFPSLYIGEFICKTKRGLQCGSIIDKDGLWFHPDKGRHFRVQWKQVYGLIVETHPREETE